MSIVFNEICINNEILPKYTYIHTYIHTYIYMCVCVCVCHYISDRAYISKLGRSRHCVNGTFSSMQLSDLYIEKTETQIIKR